MTEEIDGIAPVLEYREPFEVGPVVDSLDPVLPFFCQKVDVGPAGRTTACGLEAVS